MMMMHRVMCVLAVVLCCACGYTMTAAADSEWDDFPVITAADRENAENYRKCAKNYSVVIENKTCAQLGFAPKAEKTPQTSIPNEDEAEARPTIGGSSGDTEQQAAEGIDRQGQQQGSNPTRTENDAGEREPEPTESSKRPQNVEVPQGDQGTPSSTSDNSTSADSNATQQSSPATVNATAALDSEETNSTTMPSPAGNVSEAPTTTPSPSPVPNAEINTIASAVQKNKGNVDSSISPVWIGTAAPLLIVVVFFSATVY
ncbi:uncharacterized protein TM35_000721210 [Trypanosoma theileri]|uniref:Mucin-associated surface protein (MASP) n=1 Tax=Trypanosoma theileri TaxID=67003 RepID=A0A1X0NFX3_9TRYP|nr:uncharacterized protein TM35_000721210 [Trypanosoma theileri]ORC83418.1 hypothetical protein TM35_000721210 [Trypanosoma theileri]